MSKVISIWSARGYKINKNFIFIIVYIFSIDYATRTCYIRYKFQGHDYLFDRRYEVPKSNKYFVSFLTVIRIHTILKCLLIELITEYSYFYVVHERMYCKYIRIYDL